MDTGQAWVELAIRTLSCNQRQLSERLGVSPTQVTKWKNGEYMSRDMEEKFRAMLNVGDIYPQFILWAGSLEDAEKWNRLISYLAEYIAENAETDYDTVPLSEKDQRPLLCLGVRRVLTAMGVESPKGFPAELDSYFSGADSRARKDDDYDDELWDLVEENPYTRVIRNIFDSLNEVWGFWAAYVLNLANEDEDTLLEKIYEMESSLLDLAATKITVDEEFATKFSAFQEEITGQYKEGLTYVRDAAFRSGTPLKAELLDLVTHTPGSLGRSADAESLGYNDERIHPDIYMNELLEGMRAIQQVLPLILEKLDIDPKRLRVN